MSIWCFYTLYFKSSLSVMLYKKRKHCWFDVSIVADSAFFICISDLLRESMHYSLQIILEHWGTKQKYGCQYLVFPEEW